jgi:MarR family 2-MHQ and catechol resistance regulon transcriptional repressor
MKKRISYGTRTDQALSLWVKLARANALMVKLSGKDIGRYGLTQPQFAVIELLGHLGPMKMNAIGEKMLVTGGNTTIVVDNLEKTGLVERARCLEDRRAIWIRLTEKGDELFQKIFPQHAGFVADAVSVLSHKEISELGALLKKFGMALQEKYADDLPQRHNTD